MHWMGKVSAWGAIIEGLVLVAAGAFYVSPGGFNGLASIPLATGVLLILGAHRTLRKMSGGLRLLAGAWGVASGLLAHALAWFTGPPSGAALHDSYYVVAPPGALALYAALLLAAIAGLALTVLHKEQK